MLSIHKSLLSFKAQSPQPPKSGDEMQKRGGETKRENGVCGGSALAQYPLS